MNDTAAAARPAATLILLRDAADGLEVLMLKRHGQSDVLGGAFVFPGGKVDDDDARLDAGAHLDAAPQTLHERLGEPDIDTATATGLYVAALREAFEESGVLLGHALAPALCADAGARLRAGTSFNAVLAELGLRLAVGAMAPWSRWITPLRTFNKRFDTRFFVARLPDQGIACHDGHETVESVWLRPRAALEIYWDGAMTLAPPQIMTLAALARHDGVEAVLAEARGRPPALVLPHILGEDDARVMCYPGDEAHSVKERAMPGPLRLFERGQRFEPQAGFDAFFA